MTTDITPITPASSIEQIAHNKGILQAMKARVKELEAQHDEQMLEWMDENKVESVEIGEIRYYKGHKKDTRSHDHPALADAIMERCGGSYDEFVAYLDAQPFKHGACRALLGDAVYDLYFTTTEKPVIKDGVPTKRVLSVPTKFLAQRSAT